MSTLLLAAALAFLLSAAALTIYIPLAGRLGQLDAPNTRSAHVNPTLSSGGVALIAALLLTLLLCQLLGWIYLAPREWIAMSAVVGVCLLGALDDRRPLSVRLRLLGFFALSGLLVALYPLPGTETAIGTVFSLLLLVGFVWLLNLYNFMDGIDGIAALQCVLSCLSLSMCGLVLGAADAFLLLCVAVAAVYTAFLAFNWPPARLFMGDAGSLSAGFLLGWLGLWGVAEQGMNPVAWLIPMSPFLLDTAFTLLRRIRGRERITEAHSGHIYQRLARHWQSHRRVDLGLIGLHFFWLFPVQFLALKGAFSYAFALCLALVPQILLMAKWAPLK